ncbi:claudin-11 isoform X2 [Esox lucius]|uniref:claudin-11 isoform X2 n=1 Tax=Esox lucius TaxID=8010 RepID=UPI000576D78E|nr:claudin-11 isoform X2 [Esox lucius]
MARVCRQVTGGVASFAGWVGIIIATATHDWVRTCEYTVTTCLRMDELGTRGLWAECVTSQSLYHCVTLNQILTLPAVGLVLMSMPCVRLEDEIPATKRRRAVLGCALLFIMAVCGLVSTIWFPIGAHAEEGLMSFGPSLYAGWTASVLCLLGSSMVLCCLPKDPSTSFQWRENYHARPPGATKRDISPAASMVVSGNHAKSALV